MIVCLEKAIDTYIMRTGDRYPEEIQLNKKDYEILCKEMKQEYKEARMEVKDLNHFRGCRLKIRNDLKRFIIK